MTGSSSLEALTSRVETLRTELAAFETRVSRISMARLAVFLGAAVAVGLGLAEPNALLFGVGAAGFLVFFALVAYHGRVDEAESLVRARLDVCLRHLKRLGGTFTEFKRDGALLLPADHAYAHDIDLVGPGSLFQWIDTTHTTRGERTLLKWLGGGANTDEIRERQEAVRELAELGAFRETLEAELARRAEKLKLDPSPFLEFVGHRALFLGNLPATALLFLLPVGTIGCLVGAMLRVVPPSAWVVFVVLQIVLYLALGGRAHHAFDLVAARRGYVDAFYRAFCAIETTSFTAPRLEALKRRFFVSGDAPSKHFRSLDTWAGLAEVRRQFPLNLVLNALLLWDFHVLLGLERWNARAGRGLESLFDALGELEALASLATLPALDPSATFPEIVTDKPTFEATGLAHPLLPAEARVANDLTVTGQGSVVVVTGSNMAGKSTLLRSVGLNIALGLAGGAVVATSLRLSPVRLRASMRAADSLQRGASYFHAELTKLKGVVVDADGEPAVFFLLDELLRGTNAQARHVGARSVVVHLARRGALGLVATHDVALAELGSAIPGTVTNVHFTDTVLNGEMTFDFRLREGVVKSSNALRLLELAGIEVQA